MPRSKLQSSDQSIAFALKTFDLIAIIDIRLWLVLLLIPDIYFQLLYSGFHINGA